MSIIPNWLKQPYRITTVTLFVALFLSLADNGAFLRAAFAVVDKTTTIGTDFKIVLTLCLPALFSVLLSVVGFKGLFKPFVIFVLLSAAIISYFMGAYGVIIDTSMIQNAFETDTKEALELLNTGSIGHIVFFGLLPAWLVYRCPITYQPFLKELLSRLLVIGVAGILLGGMIFSYYKDFSLTMRENRELRFLINPTYPIYALFKYIKQVNASDVPLTAIGTDAKQSPLVLGKGNGKKSLVVIVVGETARAENFSLNGYARETNPYLSPLDIINYPNTYSCGTATAESVPCMFSSFAKEEYTVSKAKQQENLLDILARAGISVLWRDNNSGCKGVCDRVKTEAMDNLKLAELCNTEECFDEILLHELQAQLDQFKGDAVIVLHQKGSHGPAYFKRHPTQFTKFTPECVTNQVQDCSQEQITNAYDNTILYTDYFLAKVIALLSKNASGFNTAMWYMSDHGESLGEQGIYLHGLPYFLAPEQQIHIPFVLWLSPEIRDSLAIDQACLKQHSKERYSHDAIFHSLLGLMRVQTSVYQPASDVFSACRK
ncbi:MAG: phosphoethanolamine--lipid A transferase [Methylococcales bacterium]|nr:phosphoethanolamine--lipid A transferase [Methylococcales bacterium]